MTIRAVFHDSNRIAIFKEYAVLLIKTDCIIMSKQTQKDTPLSSSALVKEVCRRIRVARSYWDAHNNAACRHERDHALQLYNTLTKELLTKFPKF